MNFDSIIYFLLPLLFGWLLDLLFGDPERLPHPIVYFGKWIAFGERHLNKGTHRLLKGALFSVFSIASIFTLTALILYLLRTTLPNLTTSAVANWLCRAKGSSLFTLHSSLQSTLYFSLFTLHFSLLSVLVFFSLAGHTLRKEVRLVFEQADISLERGRKQVARIVGRDTQNLSDREVRTAALETLAENLSDGVIAPLFWYFMLGLPGMLTYKMINTLDSMIGYQNPRYKDFGCWAARIDDAANYLPARLTALIMLLANKILTLPTAFQRGSKFFTFHFSLFTLKYSSQHASPNSGWPEAALAGILDCQFGGPHDYFGELFYKPYIGTNPRPVTSTDMRLSIRVCLLSEILTILIITIIAIINN